MSGLVVIMGMSIGGVMSLAGMWLYSWWEDIKYWRSMSPQWRKYCPNLRPAFFPPEQTNT